jgi:hypothetical protein
MTMTRLEWLAIRVAIEVPETMTAHTFAAKVPWSTIEELRTELERRGVDWRPMRRRVVEVENERAQAREEARIARRGGE